MKVCRSSVLVQFWPMIISPFLLVVPVLDRILQPSTSVILGPVWVTRGAERFSPKGAYHFITTLLLSTKDRLKQSKAYKQQVRQLKFLQSVMIHKQEAILIHEDYRMKCTQNAIHKKALKIPHGLAYRSHTMGVGVKCIGSILSLPK